MTNKAAPEQRNPEAERALGDLRPLRELTDEVRTYPVKLLRLICDQYAARGAPVPDHALRLSPYLGETSLRALIEGGYVRRDDAAHIAVHAYVPTESGTALMGGRARAKRPTAKKVKA